MILLYFQKKLCGCSLYEQSIHFPKWIFNGQRGYVSEIVSKYAETLGSRRYGCYTYPFRSIGCRRWQTSLCSFLSVSIYIWTHVCFKIFWNTIILFLESVVKRRIWKRYSKKSYRTRIWREKSKPVRACGYLSNYYLAISNRSVFWMRRDFNIHVHHSQSLSSLQIREELPHLMVGNVSIARKMGFPEVILPSDARNDLYLCLQSGSFTRGGTKSSDRNIQVTIRVCNQSGEMIPVRSLDYFVLEHVLILLWCFMIGCDIVGRRSSTTRRI